MELTRRNGRGTLRPPLGRLAAPSPSAASLVVIGRLLLMTIMIITTLAGRAAGRAVRFDNTRPMLDAGGRIMDAHDGTVQRFGGAGPYYMHAVSYGLCQAPNKTGCDSPNRCGFRLDHNVSIFTSWDLSSGSWEFEGHAFHWTERPPGVLFRPALVFNPGTAEYVLWWNYVHPNGTYAGYAAATAQSPRGPFQQRRASINVTYERADVQAGDFHLFVDDDGTGYVIYSAGFWVTIEKLTADFLGVTGEMFDGFRGDQAEWGFEAPAMFKRRGIYYILFGPMCCFCYQGSGVRVYTSSSSPLGPYTYQGNDLACKMAGEPAAAASPHVAGGPEPTPGQGCLFYGDDQVSATRAQQNFVIEVQTSRAETAFIWTGDRWMQSPDGLKGHEPQFWAPLEFDEDGRIGEMDWVDRFELDIEGPSESMRTQGTADA